MKFLQTVLVWLLAGAATAQTTFNPTQIRGISSNTVYGTGGLVANTSPTLTTPNIGVASGTSLTLGSNGLNVGSGQLQVTGGNVSANANITLSKATPILTVSATNSAGAQLALASTADNGYAAQITYQSKTSGGVTNTWSVGTNLTAGANAFEWYDGTAQRMRIDVGGGVAVTGTLNASGKVAFGTSTVETSYFTRVKGGNGNQVALDNAGEQFTQLSLHNNGVQKGDLWWDQTNTRTVLNALTGGSVALAVNGTPTLTTDASTTTVTGETRSSAGFNTNGYTVSPGGGTYMEMGISSGNANINAINRTGSVFAPVIVNSTLTVTNGTGVSVTGTLSSTGNASIGGTPGATTRLSVKQGSRLYSGGFSVEDSSTDSGVFIYNDGTVNNITAGYSVSGSYSPLVLSAYGAEKLRIDSAGAVITGSLTIGSSGGVISKNATNGMQLTAVAGSSYDYALVMPSTAVSMRVATGTSAVEFPNGIAGNLTVSGTGTSSFAGDIAVGGTSSGQRVKGNYSTGVIADSATATITTTSGGSANLILIRESQATGAWALYGFSNDLAAMTLISSGGAGIAWTATYNTAASVNVYQGATGGGTGDVIIQNKTGSNKTFYIAKFAASQN